MKKDFLYLTIILLLVIGWIVHFKHHLQVEHQLEKQTSGKHP